MKKLFVVIFLVFFSFNHGYSDDWKIKNKWKISCGIVDKEALVVNGKPKKSYSKKEFKIESVILNLIKGILVSVRMIKKKELMVDMVMREDKN